MTLSDCYRRHPLARAVLRQLGGGREALDTLRDVRCGGADGGFPGFTYTDDCRAFVRRHRTALLASLEEDAADLGTSVTDLVRGFNCLRRDPPSEADLWGTLMGREADEWLLPSALAWYALEAVAFACED